MVTKALASASNEIVQSSLEGLTGKSAEEVVDNVITIYKKTIGENPDFFSFLFEMWCVARRSKKIKREFASCQDRVVSAIKERLENASEQGIIKINLSEAEALARILLAISDGTAFHMINHQEKLNDKKTWMPLRRMMLSVLNE